MAVVLSGTATRPSSGPYRSPNVFGVRPGQTVRWTAATPIAEIATAFNRRGVTVYVIGDSYHLRGGQDHTPWSKVLGRVFACDVMYADAAKIEKWILGVMRSNEDTSWIDYINVNNSQYNYAGVRQASSGDHHLHISVKKGAVNGHVTRFVALIDAFLTGKPVASTTTTVKPVATTTPTTVAKKEGEEVFFIKKKGDNKVYLSNLIVYRWVTSADELDRLKEKLKARGYTDAELEVQEFDTIGSIWGIKVGP